MPQPGETPRSQGNPWTLSDPDVAWWHATGGEDPVPDGLPAVAHAAGARDLTEHLVNERLATASELMIIDSEAEPDPPGSTKAAEPEPSSPTKTAEPEPSSPTKTAEPEPSGPTKAVESEPFGPEKAAEPKPSGPRKVIAAEPAPPHVEARLERMENSPFWLSEEERAATEVATLDRRPGRRRRPPARNPLTALLSLVLLSLVAAFFGWVSAEPFWLAVGHGDTGYATTTRCQGDGLTQRCTGRFATADGGFAVARVTLLGIAGEARQPGAISPARMVSPASAQAYTAPAGPLMHLRWGLGFLLVLICGYGIAETTGARRLPGRARRTAVIASFLGPLLLLGGFLAAAY